MLGTGLQSLYLANASEPPADLQYLVIGKSVSPYIETYEYDQGVFTQLGDPDVLPTSIVYSADWHPGNEILTLGVGSGTRVVCYQRSGSTLTKMADLPSQPASTVYGVSWNAAGTSLAVAAQSTPYLYVWNWDGTTFTRIDAANFDTLPNAGQYSVSWNGDGTQLAVVGHRNISNQSVWIYDRSGDTFTLSNSTGFKGSSSVTPTYAVGLSPTGEFLAVGYDNDIIETLAVVSDFDSSSYFNHSVTPNTPNDVRGISWNSDSDLIAIAHLVSPYLSVYEKITDVTGTYFSKISNPAALPPGNAFAVDFNRDNTMISVTGQGGSRAYSLSGTSLTSIFSRSFASGQGFATAWTK
jgi:hypothetical protein